MFANQPPQLVCIPPVHRHIKPDGFHQKRRHDREAKPA
jgi:hypothetical protein